ncbi:helix-turn-helix domain-containing protein [Sorangium atrum]|uniref:Helix-turn-helix transcriptional regulator n=1 Tax=Sorangium atrum TaxID=2995308 RepID=A0ABT5C8L8_9BACT|nr:helix-turn-helix transcriptional regulator [Sorangium aterium]MDC0682109.1 helix-turn-helix transcriptional regulator [Sorangium aterium]
MARVSRAGGGVEPAVRFNHTLLQRARLELDLTQEQVAASIGVDVRTYRRYESGAVNDPRLGFSVRSPSRRRIIERLGAELGLAEAELLVVGAEAAPGAEPAAEEAGASSQAAEAPAGAGKAPAGAGRALDEETGGKAPAGGPAPLQGAAPAWRPLHAHTLQRARHFVGRAETLDRLATWADGSPPSPRVIALLGIGGAGKTAIAERFLQGLGDTPRPGGVLVWSFYDDPRTEAFLDQAAAYFAQGAGASSPVAPRPPAAPGEQLARLKEALGQGPPHLLVLDGLETVQAEGGAGRAHGELHDALLRRLLCAVASGLGGARALVTSRFELADLSAWAEGGLAAIRPEPLCEGDAASLLRRWGIRGDDGALGALFERTGGHALSVAVLGSYVGAFLGGDAGRLSAAQAAHLAEAEHDDVLARRLSSVLSAYARALPPGERDLLARLSVFPGGAGEEALLQLVRAGGEIAGAMAAWGAAELARGLARLERLGLVFAARPGERCYSTHPFVRQHFKSLLGVPPERVHAAGSAAPPPRLDEAPRRAPREREAVDAYEAILTELLGAGRAGEAYEIYALALGGFAHLGLKLGDMARGARILRAFAGGDDPRDMPASLPARARASLAYDAGLYAGALGDLAFACACYEAHNELAGALGDPALLAMGLRTLAYTERLRGNLTGARGLLERSAEIAGGAAGSARRAADQVHAVRALALLAAVLHDLGEVDAAGERFARLRELGDAPVARRALWEAEHALALGRRDEAREATERNIAECRRRGWEGHVAHGHTLLGLALLDGGGDGDVAPAEAHLVEARRWASATGEVEVALRCHELAARIALAAGRLDDGARQALEGLHVAEACGFGPFRARLAVVAARCALARGARAAASATALADSAVAWAGEDAWARADALHWAGVARAAAARGEERARGRELLAEAAALRARLRHPGAAATREALARPGG